MERKLNADVAGDNRLMMGSDEASTLDARLRAHRGALDAVIAAHRGRAFNSAGEIQQVEIQQEMARRNAAVPADKRLAFRISLNIGDAMGPGRQSAEQAGARTNVARGGLRMED